jgi:hypothetical protein
MEDWLGVLLEYNFEVRHRPGIAMVMPDALSRVFNEIRKRDSRVAKRAGAGKDTGTHTHRIRAARAVVTDELPSNTENELKRFIRERLLKETIQDKEQRAELLRKTHAELHQGADALFRRIFRDGYFWPGLRKDCQEIIKRCTACLRWNVGREGFHPIKNLRADAPWDHIAVDLLKLDKSASGNVAVLILVDVATRFVATKPLKDCKAETVAQALYEVICFFGPPKIMQSCLTIDLSLSTASWNNFASKPTLTTGLLRHGIRVPMVSQKQW